MSTNTPTPLTGFDQTEYERRWAAMVAKFDAFEIDALCVTARNGITYLTGTTGGANWVDPVILQPSQPPTFLVRRFDEDRVRVESRVRSIRSYFGDDAIEVWAATLTDLSLANARVGLEVDRFGLTYRDVTELRRFLPGIMVVDASALTAAVMDIKTPAEIAAMRRAAAINRAGLDAFYGTLQEGVTGATVTTAVQEALMAAGSEVDFVQVVLGAETALPHGMPTESARLRPGDPAFIEFSGAVSEYSAGTVRTALLGYNPDVEALHDVALCALRAIGENLRPGATTGDVDAAARTIVEAAGRGDTFRHRSGYAIPIFWARYGLGRGCTSITPGDPGDTTVIQEHMAFHTPIILFERGRFGVGCSETWLVTTTGNEPLSGRSPDLVRLPSN